jgi:hypothetical protein
MMRVGRRAGVIMIGKLAGIIVMQKIALGRLAASIFL